MIGWKPSLLVVLAAVGLHGCDVEPPRTAVVPPQNSLPDETVLRPQSAALPSVVTPPAPTTAPEAPTAATPPQTAVVGGPPGPADGSGLAAPTELSSAPQPAAAASAAATGRQDSAELPRVRNAGDAEGARLLAQRTLQVPVVGVQPTALSDNYEQSRGRDLHEAIDIVAPTGTPVVAVDDGRIAKLFTSRAGGFTVYQFDPVDRLAYYYAHLDRYADGLREGMEVRRGDLIGYVGSSGNADPRVPHLHFAVLKLGSPPKWWEGEAVNPYPALSRAAPAQQVAGR